jgi:hypothetical protein
MLTDDRYKELMADVGMPNSRSLLQTLKQCSMESALTERKSAYIARSGCLVPPDGGSPTEDEADMCDAIAERILSR